MTFTTACALVIVNNSTEVFDFDCICRTNLCTLHTAYTTCFTLFSCNSTLFMVFAKHCSLSNINGEEVDKVSWAILDTHLTSLTLIWVDSCNTVADEDSFIRTNFHTVTKTDTTMYAVFGAAEKLSCNLTRLNTTVFELFFYIVLVGVLYLASFRLLFYRPLCIYYKILFY